MNQIKTTSTYERPDWPVAALPKHWIEALFSRMALTYGDRFTMMWRGSSVEELQRVWGMELFKLSRAQLEAGGDTLVDLVKCPTLPEFVAHCKSARVARAAHTAPLLASDVKVDPAVMEENMSRIRAACRAAVVRSVIKRGDEA